jgi:site-specific DNA-methyltransferase (adenine-specific)
VDLVLTDPPYNIGFSKYAEYEDNLSDEDYIELLSELQQLPCAIIHYPEEMMRYVVPALGIPNEVLAWCYNSNIGRQFRLINLYNVKADYSRVLMPYKNPKDKRIRKLIESGSEGRPMYDWFSDIQLVKNVSTEKTDHPCPVPIDLMERVINLTTALNSIILDPFLGSGTTAVAAKQLGRKFIGIEISQKYADIAVQRLAQSVMAL